MRPDYSLYFVADSEVTGGRSLLTLAEEALKGGVTLLQLRCKNDPIPDFLYTAYRMKELCYRYGVPFIVNDRVDIALAVDADGVHLGQNDLPCVEARRLLGNHKIIGISAEEIDQAITAEQESADYIGAQSVFTTASKLDVGPAIGPEGLRRFVEAVKIPVVGIGGINASNAVEVRDTGAAGIAVISAIGLAPDVKSAAKELKTIMMKH